MAGPGAGPHHGDVNSGGVVPTRDPGDGAEAPGPGLSVATVARRLGVAPATLRTWDRRYGLGPSEHVPGAHRRYTAADLARLEHMRRLVLEGVPPGDAARDALALDPEPGAGVIAWSPPAPPARTGGRGDGTAESPAGGGQVVPLPGGLPAARGLARAATALDGTACTAIVAETLDRRGVVWTWENLAVPVLRGVGQKWADTGRGVEVEHLLSHAIASALTGLVGAMGTPVNVRPILLASAPDELHSLPLHAVAAGLAERRIGVRMLGARVPADALVQAVRRTGPGAVLVWSQLEATADTAVLDAIPDCRPAPAVLAAGPGWGPVLPDRVERVDDLTGAIIRLARAVGA